MQPMFESAAALADWLESLHATLEDGTTIDNRKWEPAQRAAAAVRQYIANPGGSFGFYYPGPALRGWMVSPAIGGYKDDTEDLV